MIYFKNSDIKNKFFSTFNGELNIQNITENAERNNLSFGYLETNNNGEIRIAIGKDYAYIDDMGELQEANGCFKKYLDYNSSVTELENKLCDFIDVITNHALDIVCLGKIEL